MIAAVKYRLRRLLRRRAVERELAEEMAHHASSGGGNFVEADAVAEAVRDQSGVRGLEQLGRNLRWAARSLRSAPGFTVPAVLTLALGMGAAIAIFSVADAVLLQPLAYPSSSQLVLVRERMRAFLPNPVAIPASDISYVKAGGAAFAAVGAYTPEQLDLTGAGAAQRLDGERVSPELLETLGAAPELGRSFTPAEDRQDAGVVLLSDGLWRSQFGADRGIVGKSLELNGKAMTVVGVMPPSFSCPPRGMPNTKPARLWTPLALTSAERADVGDNFDFGVIARLRPGASIAQAQAQMTITAGRIQQMWERSVGKVPGLHLEMVVDPLREVVVAGSRKLMDLLLGAAGLLLLLSCANTANLFLVRSSARRREWALRAALGAGRRQVVVQALTEAWMLAAVSAGAGLAFAWGCLRGIAAAAPATLPQVHGLRLNGTVLAFAGLLTLLAGPLVGVLAARAAAAGDLNRGLREDGRSLAGNRRESVWRKGLVIAQVAVAFVLACGTALLVRSYLAALAGGAGVATEGRLTATVSLPQSGYAAGSQVAAFHERLRSSLAGVPGVASVAASSDLPTESDWDHLFTVDGQPTRAGAKVPDSAQSIVLGPYFATLGIPVLQGRDFNPQETQGNANVVIVSAALAAKYWPRRSALGQRLKWGPAASKAPWLQVVGVVGDVKDTALDTRAALHTYTPYLQDCRAGAMPGVCRSLHVVMDSRMPEAAAARQLRAAVAQLDPSAPVTEVDGLNAVLSNSITPRRFNTLLIAFFGSSALALAAIGLYGVLAFVVAGQRREFGVRLALGARPRQILLATLRHGLGWALVGLGAGGVLAYLAMGLVKGMLYQTTALDPWTWVAAAALLLALAGIACLVPAWRASRIPPGIALREG